VTRRHLSPQPGRRFWRTFASALLALSIGGCGGAPSCALDGAELRVVVDASDLEGLQRICIEDRCSSEGAGVERFVAIFDDERPERVSYDAKIADGSGQTLRSGGVQLACDAPGRDVTVTLNADGSDQISMR